MDKESLKPPKKRTVTISKLKLLQAISPFLLLLFLKMYLFEGHCDTGREKQRVFHSLGHPDPK